MNLRKMDKLAIGKLRRGYTKFKVFIGGLISVLLCYSLLSFRISVCSRGGTYEIENGEVHG